MPSWEPECYYHDHLHVKQEQQEREEFVVWLPTVSREVSHIEMSHEQSFNETNCRSTATTITAFRLCCHHRTLPPKLVKRECAYGYGLLLPSAF